MLCMQASLRASSPGGEGMREGKGEDLIGQILTTQHQRSHKGVLGVEFKFMRRQCKLSFPFSIPLPLPRPPLSRESLLAGYMQVQECPKRQVYTQNSWCFLLAKGKEREGFIKPNWCGRVLRLSILCYYKTYQKILIVCFFCFCFCLYGVMPAGRLGMHALQEKNKRHKPGIGHVL